MNVANARTQRFPGGFPAYLLGWTMLLATVFTIAGNVDGAGLSGAVGRLLYWLLHVGSGLLLLSGALAALQRTAAASWPAWTQIALSGAIGLALFMPVGIAIEIGLDIPGAPAGTDDWLAEYRARGLAGALLGEVAAVAPPFLAAWVLVNLAYLLPVPGSAVPEESAPAAPAAAAGATPQAAAAVADNAPAAADPAAQAPAGLLALLPPALGTDLVHLESDLNYLNVQTRLGSTVVLYSLTRAAAELGDAGLVVHRAHWVAIDHVRRVRRRGNGLVLTLSTGAEVPVSRRRQATVRAQFGTYFDAAGVPAESGRGNAAG
ncbi:MAG: LytTR family DNA-binding domain-containing protein [Gammaproteobacteria bacterium]